MGRWGWVAGALLIASCALVGGRRLEDRTSAPTLPASALELVADVDYPPGNIAVSRTGRVFFTLHPTGSPPMKLVELVGGRPVPYPDAAQQAAFNSVLAVRIDRQDRLWALDYASYGWGQPRLVGFDLATNQVVHEYDFPSDVAGFLSMLNDFQVDPRGERIYIAEASPIRQHPALVIYDIAARTSRRVLDGDRSVQAMDYVMHAPGRAIKVLGLFPVRIGVDSIGLDVHGEWLYYGPFTGDRLYRVPTRALDDPALPAARLAAEVEDFGPKTLSDGLSVDDRDTVYITDPEHSAILTLGPDRARDLQRAAPRDVPRRPRPSHARPVSDLPLPARRHALPRALTQRGRVLVNPTATRTVTVPLDETPHGRGADVSRASSMDGRGRPSRR